MLPAGTYSYKVAINKTWDENYGAGGVPNGANIDLTSDGTTPITFYYDHRTHFVTSTAQGPIVVAAGSFQSEMGCAADWDPACMRSWLQDPDGDGTYTLSTTQIPPGTYDMKVALDRTWDVNYGAGGVPGGANIPFTVPDVRRCDHHVQLRRDVACPDRDDLGAGVEAGPVGRGGVLDRPPDGRLPGEPAAGRRRSGVAAVPAALGFDWPWTRPG